MNFADEIEQALIAAGIPISSRGRTLPAGHPPRGVIITVLDPAKPPEAAFIIRKAFRESIGIDPPIEKPNSSLGFLYPDENTAQIDVYEKSEVNSAD